MSLMNPSTSNTLPIFILGTFTKVCHLLNQQQNGGTLAVAQQFTIWCAMFQKTQWPGSSRQLCFRSLSDPSESNLKIKVL